MRNVIRSVINLGMNGYTAKTKARKATALSLAMLLVVVSLTAWLVPALATAGGNGNGNGHGNSQDTTGTVTIPSDEVTGTTSTTNLDNGQGATINTDTGTSPDTDTGSDKGRNGTTLEACIFAEGSSGEKTSYDWDIEKTVSPETITIERGQSETVTYTIKVTRGEPTVEQNAQVTISGGVCIKNGGGVATEGLKLRPQVEYNTGGGFNDLSGAFQSIVPADPIPAGSKICYPFSITFTPVEGATYRVSANITITNHSGHLGDDFGPNPKTGDVTMTGASTIDIEDEAANVFDYLTLPAGFSTDSDVDDLKWTFTESGQVTYTRTITNDSASCGQDVYVNNTATIIECDTEDTDSDSARVAIFTGLCTTTTNPPTTNPPTTNPPTTNPPTTNPPTTNPPTTNPPTTNPPTTPTTVVAGEEATPTPTTVTTPPTTQQEASSVERKVLPFTGLDNTTVMMGLLLILVGGYLYTVNRKEIGER